MTRAIEEWHALTVKDLDDRKQALDIIVRVADHALPRGFLAGQVDPCTDRLPSVNPLTSSHAEFVSTVPTHLQQVQKIRASTPRIQKDR